MTTAMTLAELIGAEAGAHAGVRVHGLELDSRAIRAGEAFVALQGANAHGITFAPAALAQGASVVLADAPAPPAFSSLQPVVQRSARRPRPILPDP